MGQFWGVATLAFVGVIIADLMTHPQGVTSAGAALNQNLTTTFGAMLGN